MKDIFLIISSILAFAAYVTYINAILKKKAKPHRTTRLITFIITALATVSLFAKNNQVAIWLTGIFAFNPSQGLIPRRLRRYAFIIDA